MISYPARQSGAGWCTLKKGLKSNQIKDLVPVHMTFTKGNKLAANSKAFQQALKRAIAQSDGEALRDIADAQLERARRGDLPAAIFIRETLDGKPSQTIDAALEINDRPAKELSIGELQRVIACEIDRNGKSTSQSSRDPSGFWDSPVYPRSTRPL